MSDSVYTRPPVQQSNNQCPVTARGEAFNPFAHPYLGDPYPHLADARENEPVFYNPETDHWVITRYEDVRDILRDYTTYSSRMAQSPVAPWPKEAAELFQAQGFDIKPTFSNNDPPSHTKVRQFTRDAFTPKRIKWIEPHVRRLVNEAIDRIIDQGSADLVQTVFYETPARVLFEFLGIPGDNVEQVKVWSQGRALLTWGKPSDDEIIELMPKFIDYLKYCFDMVDYLHENPGEDYTSELIKVFKEEKPEGITNTTIVIALFGLLMAGHETTTNQSSLGFRALLTHRESWEALCADPSLIPNAVEEIIRYDSSVISWRRVTNKPVELHGVQIPEGAQLLLMLAGANRDEAEFKGAETFNIYRKRPQRHMSLGHGIHYCLGAPLARLELAIFLEEFTRRMPSLRLSAEQDYQYSPNVAHRGLQTLKCEWDVA